MVYNFKYYQQFLYLCDRMETVGTYSTRICPHMIFLFPQLLWWIFLSPPPTCSIIYLAFQLVTEAICLCWYRLDSACCWHILTIVLLVILIFLDMLLVGISFHPHLADVCCALKPAHFRLGLVAALFLAYNFM